MIMRIILVIVVVIIIVTMRNAMLELCAEESSPVIELLADPLSDSALTVEVVDATARRMAL